MRFEKLKYFATHGHYISKGAVRILSQSIY